jgi:hypothetical protein
MHTSDILRSEHFHVTDSTGTVVDITAGLTPDDRLGVVSPRYEDAIAGASGTILHFVTAFYDIQRARHEETGEPFFVYPDYFVFLLGDGEAVRGISGSAPLAGPVSDAYGWLDVWPAEKWVVVRGVVDLWRQIDARGITHLLLPARPSLNLGAMPPAVSDRLKAFYRYLAPGETGDGPAVLRLDLSAEPRGVIAEALRRLPDESPAHAAPAPASQYLVALAE